MVWAVLRQEWGCFSLFLDDFGILMNKLKWSRIILANSDYFSVLGHELWGDQNAHGVVGGLVM